MIGNNIHDPGPLTINLMIDITMFTKFKMIQLTRNESELFAPANDNPVLSGDLLNLSASRTHRSSIVNDSPQLPVWEAVEMDQMLSEKSILFLLIQCKNYIQQTLMRPEVIKVIASSGYRVRLEDRDTIKKNE